MLSDFQVRFDETALVCAPALTAGIILASLVRNSQSNDAIEALLGEAEAEIHSLSLSRSQIAALPEISAWHATYARFGANAARFPCAAESLLRRVAKGDHLPRINTMVNLCNALSLRAHIPIAACDISQVQGPLTIRKAVGTETFLPLGNPGQPEHPDVGEVIYADEGGFAHSRRWNWRQSDLIKTTDQSSLLLFTVEAAHEGASALVEATTHQLATLLRPFASGDLELAFLNAECPEHRFKLQPIAIS